MRKKLLILCYHGFEIADESQCRPKLFIKKETFERRLKYLHQHSVTVLPLDKAVEGIENDSLADNSVVITIDDGFYSVLKVAYPLLHKYGFPATLYQMSKDMLTGMPVLPVLIAYMIETTTKNSFIPNQHKFGNIEGCDLTCPEHKEKFIDSCISFARTLDSSEKVEQFYKEFGNELAVDYENIKNLRFLSLLNESEVLALASTEINVQLHTHSHQFPQNNAAEASLEIKKNKQILEPLTEQPLVHFCYPAGKWSTSHWSILAKEGVKSATTCLPGLNDSSVNMLALNRFLDGENIPHIVFEAEVYRFSECIRILRNKISRSRSSTRDI
ncbi:MAG: polysaccharide deacetylase family protein [Methyloprofundus sp.]|nr:polysaccharide deacetylase family protein [Methyloprofundus sp.]